MAKPVTAGEPAGLTSTEASPSAEASRARRTAEDRAALPSRRMPVPEVTDLVIAACQHPTKTVCLTLLAAAAFAVVAWVAVPPFYETSSLVRVRLHEDFLFTAQQSRAEDAAFVQAQKEIAVEPQVLAAALQRPEMAAAADYIPQDTPIDWLRDQIRVENPRASEVMSISGKHTDPGIAQVLCNAVTSAYLDEITTRQRTIREVKEAELERAARKADELLNEKWLQLHSVADEVGSGNSQSLTVRDQIQLQAYREYAQQLRTVQLQGNTLESQLAEEQVRVQQQEELSEAAFESLLRSHPDVVAARERLESIEAEIREIKPLIPHQETPQMMRLRQERELYVEELESIRKEIEPQLRERSRARLASNHQAALEQLKKQIELNKNEETFLRNTLAELESEIARTGDDNGIRLEMVRHAIDRQEHLADGLWQSLEQLRIESQAPPRIALIALAPLPKKPQRGRQLKVVAAATAVGIVAVVFGIGYVEWRSCRIRHLEDVTARAQLPAYGFDCAGYGASLLGVRGRKGRRLTSGAAEAASQLILQSTETGVPTVAVSSAIDGEPRDVVALEMASVFAGFGRRTLLIDADVSAAQLTRRMKATDLPGLTDLRAKPTHQCIHSTTRELLDFIPAGVAARDLFHPPVRLVQEAVGAVAAKYDAVVINATAILGSAESVLIAAQADQTVVVAMRGASRWDLLASARHRAESAGLSLLGAVLHSGKSSAEVKQVRVAAEGSNPAVQNRAGATNTTASAGRDPSALAAASDVDAEDRLKAEVDQLRTDLEGSSEQSQASSPSPESTQKTS